MTILPVYRWLLAATCLLPVVSGCAAFRPIRGLPARYMPDEFRGASRSGKQTIDLSLLRQTPPGTHLVDAGDLLSVYVEGELGRRDQPPPAFFPTNNLTPPSVGFPIPVREDGTISLPLVGALSVRGLSIRQVEDRMREEYTVRHSYLREGARIFVALQQPRSVSVTVFRQESATEIGVSAQGQLNIGAAKRGTGKKVQLPIYKNDVLNALAETGGLPGLDAENAIYVIRNETRPVAYPAPMGPAAPYPSSAHRHDAIIRSQSPDGFRPQADYRSAGGWSTPVGTNPYAPRTAVTQAQYAPPPLAPSPGTFSAPAGQSPYAQPYSAMTPPPPAMTPIPDGGLSPAWSQPAQVPMTPPLSGMQPPPAMWPAPTTPEMGPAWTGPSAGGQPWTGPPQMPPQPALPPSDGSAWSTPSQPGPGPQDAWYPPAGATPNWSGAPGTIGDLSTQVGEDLSGRRIIRIPVRLGPGEFTDIREEDIILHEGDIVFIESRETEVFYTGGLLGGGQYTLPRDYDLDVLGAIAVAQGQGGGAAGGSRATQSAGGQSALNADVSISASQLIVLRPLADGTQLTLQVDLYEAVRNPNERIIVQPGDYLILQYTRAEAVMAFFERHLLEGALFGVAAAQLNQGGGN